MITIQGKSIGMAVFAILTLQCLVFAQDFARPFGPISAADVDQLAEFAKTAGFDLKGDVERAYQKDEAALGRLFRLSLCFSKLDLHARTYGQIICSSFLNLGEGIGVEAYAGILGEERPDVQQRVRDFLYYPNLQVPKEHRTEVEKQLKRAYPALFPNTFEFGRNDPIFAKDG